MSHQFKNKDEENKFLTLSEIFTDVKPDQILNKLNEAHGDVESAIEKILSAKGGSTPRPERANSPNKPESSEDEKTKKSNEDLGLVQKTLEDIYEKSFELLESKIKEQASEIENLLNHLKTTKEQINLRDMELSRVKNETENLKTQLLEANSAPLAQSEPSSCKCDAILNNSVVGTQKAIDAGLSGIKNLQLSSRSDSLSEFDMKFKATMGFAFLNEAMQAPMSKEMLEQFMAMKIVFDQQFHVRSEELNRQFNSENTDNRQPSFPNQEQHPDSPKNHPRAAAPLQQPISPLREPFAPIYPKAVPLPGVKQSPYQAPMMYQYANPSTNPFNNNRGPNGQPLYSAPAPHPASGQYYYYSAPPQQPQQMQYMHPVPPLVKQQSYPGLSSSQHQQ